MKQINVGSEEQEIEQEATIMRKNDVCILCDADQKAVGARHRDLCICCDWYDFLKSDE